ncbi:MAG: 4-hydroxythreonine-4-phosphate dehydrogenase PdxA [Thermodesulfovibrionales bacterium]|nr:4-hydroxythreonine-4-phosphate dehydrogenase PdxA [Thermodesulfovibrionales bacterium]
MKKRRKIAITIGDPGGIGPEVTLKALLDESIFVECNPLIVGDRCVINEAVEAIKIPFETNIYDILETGSISNRRFKRGEPTIEGGKACVEYIKKAVELASLGIVNGIVTAPISKESLRMAGFPWPGHTEMLAELTNTKNYAMFLYSEYLKVILVTTHVSFKDIPKLITKDKVFNTILNAYKASKMLSIDSPRIAVCGLNPHAGEGGIFGKEEIEQIIPAIERAISEGIIVSGPFPSDSLFWRAYNGEFDIVVCMYHDQGLIPLKMLAFNKGVNITIGLPFIRTSPAHGTAYDIAWRGVADPSSMIEAIKIAAKLEICRNL